MDLIILVKLTTTNVWTECLLSVVIIGSSTFVRLVYPEARKHDDVRACSRSHSDLSAVCVRYNQLTKQSVWTEPPNRVITATSVTAEADASGGG